MVSFLEGSEIGEDDREGQGVPPHREGARCRSRRQAGHSRRVTRTGDRLASSRPQDQPPGRPFHTDGSHRRSPLGSPGRPSFGSARFKSGAGAAGKMGSCSLLPCKALPLPARRARRARRTSASPCHLPAPTGDVLLPQGRGGGGRETRPAGPAGAPEWVCGGAGGEGSACFARWAPGRLNRGAPSLLRSLSIAPLERRLSSPGPGWARFGGVSRADPFRQRVTSVYLVSCQGGVLITCCVRARTSTSQSPS